MSEEYLAQESEEEGIEEDSSDDLIEDEEVEEGKTAKASVKKEQEDDEEDEEEDEEEDDEEPAEGKKVKKEAVIIPKTKNQMLKNIYDSVNGMLKGDLATKYEEILAATNLETVKEEVKEVKNGYECGVMIENYSNIKINDIIEIFEVIETARRL